MWLFTVALLTTSFSAISALGRPRAMRPSGGAVRLILDAAVDSDSVLKAAMAAGQVTEFVFERRRLSEVFREALA
jgi:hypothetical protein